MRKEDMQKQYLKYVQLRKRINQKKYDDREWEKPKVEKDKKS